MYYGIDNTRFRPRSGFVIYIHDRSLHTGEAMKYLGLDYGSKYIGVAISDTRGAMAFPREIIVSDHAALGRIVQMVKEEKIDQIIMGDTRANNDLPNIVTPEAESFADALTRATGKPVARVSELWTSFEAARYAPDQNHNDAAAAAIILQRYIDMRSS